MLTTPNKTHLLSVLFFALFTWHGSAMAVCVLDANGSSQTSNNLNPGGLSSLSSGGQQSYALALCAGLVAYECVISSTGKIWLDRNLGAQAACGSGDCAGDLYQWGRDKDGHEKRTPLSSTSAPAIRYDATDNANFITTNAQTTDWATADNDGFLRQARWSDTDGSSICPRGFRVPTDVELTAEFGSWTPQNAAGALASPLKWPATGYRTGGGSLSGNNNYVWSSTPSGGSTRLLSFTSSNALVFGEIRKNGAAVRCIQGI